MMNYGKYLIYISAALLMALLLSISLSVAAKKKTQAEKSASAYHSWTFVGRGRNEADESIYYYFQLQQQIGTTVVQALVVKEGMSKPLHYYKCQPTENIDHADNFSVGKAFLSFDPVSDSWVFGLKLHEGQRFNFRVELLEQLNGNETQKSMADGIDLIQLMPKRVNGHLKLEKKEKEEFLTADQNWYRHVIRKNREHKNAIMEGVFCFFEDKSRLYAFTMPMESAKLASEVIWLNPDGKPVKVSQFIEKQWKDKRVNISLAVPSTKLQLDNVYQYEGEQPLLKAGFTEADKKPSAFCFLDSSTSG